MTQALALTVSSLPVRANEKLTTDARNRLVKIVESEFVNKESLYHQVQQEESKKILKAYYKKVGFNKLQKQYEEIEIELTRLNEKKNQIRDKVITIGLDLNGEPRKSQVWDYNLNMYHTDYDAKELNDLLKTIERNGPTQNLKNKLITRLSLATTIGEANVIMREVLGNGLIPTLKEGDIKNEG